MTPTTRSPRPPPTCPRSCSAPTATSSQAILGYNHSPAYVSDVLARARAYARAGDGSSPPRSASRRTRSHAPQRPRRAGRPGEPARRRARRGAARLPRAAVLGAGRPRRPGAIDARLYDDAVWILRRYHLRVSAAREAGHHTHGDGTALDLIPADDNAPGNLGPLRRPLAHDLGWTPACARSGTRPACQLAPAIQFIGYDGYPDHGSPRTCTGGLPRPPAPLLGLPLLRHQQPLPAL